MNTKWYIGTLLLILAFIGLNQEQTKVANQQIVLQFTDVETTSKTTYDSALSTITTKLRSLGISDIEILDDANTQLSLRYYSEVDAQHIREILSNDVELSLAFGGLDESPVDKPKEEFPESYHFIVFDLQQQSDNDVNLNGKFAPETNEEFTRFSNTMVIRFNNAVVLGQVLTEHVAYKVRGAKAIVIDRTSETIPEVRAGPSFSGNC